MGDRREHGVLLAQIFSSFLQKLEKSLSLSNYDIYYGRVQIFLKFFAEFNITAASLGSCLNAHAK